MPSGGGRFCALTADIKVTALENLLRMIYAKVFPQHMIGLSFICSIKKDNQDPAIIDLA